MGHFSRPDRLRDIADRFNVDHDAVLDNVLYARAYTSKSPLHLDAWAVLRLAALIYNLGDTYNILTLFFSLFILLFSKLI